MFREITRLFQEFLPARDEMAISHLFEWRVMEAALRIDMSMVLKRFLGLLPWLQPFIKYGRRTARPISQGRPHPWIANV
ncbi:hypothetical protein C7U61_17815 [Rhizobium sp. JAB6]|nr:hypothetical protein C7U61_17815 [Rhizobium sp. JAB6]